MSDIKLDAAEKRRILEKIIHSEEFANNEVYQKFLSYLVEASIEKRNLKEATIAMEYFDRNARFNPAEDPTVRVHFHNLRKKLQTYYLSEGKEDKIRLCAPKGKYEISFDQVEIPRSNPKFRISLRNISFFLLFPLAFGVIYLWSSNKETRKVLSQYQHQNNEWIWSEFFENDKPILLVFGDYYGYEIYNGDIKRRVTIRDETINSENDLELFLSKYPDFNDMITKRGKSALLRRDVEWFWNIVPLLYPHYQNIQVKICSQLDWKDIQDNNIIFLGSFKTLGIFNYFINKSKIRYEHFPHQIHLLNSEKDTLKTFRSLYAEVPFKKYNKDYAIALKIPGPANNHIFIFAGFYFIGIDGALKYFMHPSIRTQKSANISETIQQKPKYFESIFEVEGFQTTRLKIEILEFNEFKIK